MKKTKLLVLALILGSISTGAISANAEEATGKIEFIQGAGSNGDDLYIDHVSKLDFGQKSISLTDQEHWTYIFSRRPNGYLFRLEFVS